VTDVGELEGLSRRLVQLCLQGLRLPVTTAEIVSGHRGDPDWPPTLAYEAVEARAKQMIGTLLGDRQLAAEGKLREAKLDRLEQAAVLEAEAEEARRRAQDRQAEREERIDQTRQAVRRRQESKKEETQRQAAAKKQQARRAARRRQEATEEIAGAREDILERRRRADARRQLTDEELAVAGERRALESEREAQAVDEALEAKRAQRRRR
jgi:hypothetical protein